MFKPLIVYLVVLLLIVSTAAEEENDSGCSAAADVNSATDLKYKIVAIFSTLLVGVFGICLPMFSRGLDDFVYSVVKISNGYLVMGLTPILYMFPDAKESLTSSCIQDFLPWDDFPMTRVVAMAAVILTIIESKSFASACRNRSQNGDDPIHVGNITQGHSVSHNKTRQNLVTQFLELGIVVHSLIIGMALGASPDLSIIKPLTAAITYHQLFEGIGRGRCISKAKFELKKTLIMVIMFSLTAPVGIGIGIGVAEIYYKNGSTMLIVSGSLNAATAGILLFVTGVTGFDSNIFEILLASCVVFLSSIT